MFIGGSQTLLLLHWPLEKMPSSPKSVAPSGAVLTFVSPLRVSHQSMVKAPFSSAVKYVSAA